MWPFSKSKDDKKNPGKLGNAAPAAVKPRYDAVEIIPANYGACNAVRALAGKRFLSRKMPKLPLPECDRPQCECGYKYHKDRRDGPRRVSDLDAAILTLPDEQEDRRDASTRGRRRTDNAQR